MIYETPSLKRQAVARAIGHPTDDLKRVSGAVLNMTAKHGWLEPESRPTAGAKTENWYTPAQAVTAAVIQRLWQAGFSNGETFDAAVTRLKHWRLTDDYPDLGPEDPVPEEAKGEPHPDRPATPAGFILRDFCENAVLWTLQVDVRRHAVTGRFRHVAGLMRGDGDWLGNGVTAHEGEEPLSAHVIVLDGVLQQVASHTIFKGGRNGTH